MATLNFDGIYVLPDYSADGNPYECCNPQRVLLPANLNGLNVPAAFQPAEDDRDIKGKLVNLLSVGQGERWMRPWKEGFANNLRLERYNVVLEVNVGKVSSTNPANLTLMTSVNGGQTHVMMTKTVQSLTNLEPLKAVKRGNK